MKRAPDSERRRVCARCAKVFFVKPCKAGVYCSNSCKNEAHRTTPKNDPRPCSVCATVFTPSRHYGHARYCSWRCIWLATKGPSFNALIARESRRKNSESQRGRGEGKAYRKLFGRHEHRVVVEQSIGRRLTYQEVVHHLDGNHLNNDLGNLQILTRAEHMRAHGLGIRGVRPKHEPWKARWSR